MRICKRVPSNRRDSLLSANRHTCCVCRQPRHPVEIHHINGDPSDNTWNNLAVICRNCHGLVTAKGILGGNYTPGELLHYKREWETCCAEADAGQVEVPLEEIHETKRIEGGEHEIYPFEMEKGEDLVFSIDASDPLDSVVCDERDAETWVDGEVEDDDARPLPKGYIHLTGLSECRERSFTAPADGSYVLLLVNWEDQATEVTVDASVWETQE